MNTKWLQKIKRFFDAKAVVLMYHRVADLLFDPFELGVSPENFEAQLQVLTKNYKLIKATELVNQVHERSVISNSVCVTFDDGYWDNYFTASPLLTKYQCPATFYIVSGSIGKAQPFWWDELQHIFLNTPKLPPRLSIDINGERFESELENNGELTQEQWQQQRKWLFIEKPVTQRCELYVKIWEQLKPLTYAQLQKVIEALKSWSNPRPPSWMDDFPMTGQQLQAMAGNPLFEIGVHTTTHPSLPFFNREQQGQEIAVCKERLEIACGKHLNTLSYPYGDYNDATLSIVKEKKIQGAFTTNERVVTQRTDPFCLGRFQVKNWNGKEFAEQLVQWFKQ